MQSSKNLIFCFAAILLVCAAVNAQQAAAPSTSVVVPRLVNFSGKATDPQGKPVSGIAGITFSIYGEQYEGAPLWMETQNVSTDAKGDYTVQLGATSVEGLPLDLFASGEARWLGVRVNNGEEQPRVLLLSVPYALKAADAETIGGLPPSAFVLAVPPTSSSSSVSASAASSTPSSLPSSLPALGGTGTTDYVPLWTNSTTLGNSVLFQSGTGSAAKVGINTTTPASTLDVKGTETVRGLLSLPATGTATATSGKNSQPLAFAASAYNSSTGTAASQTFQWQAEPTNNDTSAANGTLNLLFAQGSKKLAETGLNIASNGQITFAPGQTFPGTGKGTVTSVGLSAPSSDFTVTGSPVTGSGTLGLNWTVAPTSADTANAIVKRDANGMVNVTAVNANTTIAALTALFGFSDSGIGVSGVSNGTEGVFGQGTTGVYGQGSSAYGVFGTVGSSGIDGLHGESDSENSGVAGLNFNSTSGYGVYGQAESPGGIGGGFYNTSTGDALFAYNQSGGWAAFFDGNVDVDGNLSKAGGSFKIDHPLDPANKYLYHSFVESPDMMNVYNGNIATDSSGVATVTLPDWFEKLNKDFRYQLTVIGEFAQAIVAKEIEGNQFEIKTNLPNVKVSWQITGIRQDPWANAHRIPVEEEKEQKLKGFYLHPELYGAPAEKGIEWARHPGMMKKLQQTRDQMKEKQARLSESPATR